MGLVSDYRYRGVSLSGGKPALQASLDFEQDSGAHAGLWSSTLTGGTPEVDASAGYTVDLAGGVSLDLSATYYLYPGSFSDNALEAGATLEMSRGPLSLNAGASIAPPQSGTRDEAGAKRTNLYWTAGGSLALNPWLSARVQAGHERGPWDASRHGGKWDWTAGLDLEVDRARLSLDWTGSDRSGDAFVASAFLTF